MGRRLCCELLLVHTLVACNGTSENAGSNSGGGAIATGGAVATGGAIATGGAVATGSAIATGGAVATGSTIGSGGTLPVAETSTTSPAKGGSSGTGGTSAKGGSSSAGGSVPKGGSSSAGGTSAKGGSTSAGGSIAKGGSSSTGGTSAKGGTTSAGGSIPKGGSSSTGGAPPSSLPKHIIGADVTISLEDEYYGATYTDNGTKKSIEQLLKDHGFNFIRLDTFVDPSATGGYAVGKPEAYRDLAHTITFAKRVKAIGLGFMLDLHYSNTWTNPTAQATPPAWAGLAIAALSTQVYNYTKDAVTQLKAAGARPDIVQVGNEVTSGMLWELGRASGSNFANFATLLKSGIQAVRDVDSSIQILLHIEKCNNYATTKWWLDGVLNAGVAFDILGQSCYATAPNGVAGYQGTPTEWATVFSQLATNYPNLKFIIAEYSAEQRAAHDVMRNLPNGRGLGAFNWDPTRAYTTHPNHPLFTTNGAWNAYVAAPSLMALYDKMATDYGLRAAAPPPPVGFAQRQP